MKTGCAGPVTEFDTWMFRDTCRHLEAHCGY
jgi:hypothetical protein